MFAASKTLSTPTTSLASRPRWSLIARWETGWSLAGHDVVTERNDVRREIGLVFRTPRSTPTSALRRTSVSTASSKRAGQIVALDTPQALKAAIGTDRIRLGTDDEAAAAAAINRSSGWRRPRSAAPWCSIPSSRGAVGPSPSPCSWWSSPRWGLVTFAVAVHRFSKTD